MYIYTISKDLRVQTQELKVICLVAQVKSRVNSQEEIDKSLTSKENKGLIKKIILCCVDSHKSKIKTKWSRKKVKKEESRGKSQQ